MALTITRKEGQRLRLDVPPGTEARTIEILIKETRKTSARISIDAPREITITRPDSHRPRKTGSGSSPEEAIERALTWDDTSAHEISSELDGLGADTFIDSEGSLVVFGAVLELDHDKSQWTIPAERLTSEKAVVGWIGAKIRHRNLKEVIR